MSQMPSFAPLAVANPGQAAPTLNVETDFEARWAAWMLRGRQHEQLVRRNLIGLVGVVAAGVAIAYALMR